MSASGHSDRLSRFFAGREWKPIGHVHAGSLRIEGLQSWTEELGRVFVEASGRRPIICPEHGVATTCSGHPATCEHHGATR